MGELAELCKVRGEEGDAVSRGCVVHRDGEVVDIGRAAHRGLGQGRFCLHSKLTDFGFAFAAKNALCTETAAVQLESMVRARLRPGFRIQRVAVNSGDFIRCEQSDAFCVNLQFF